MIIKYSVLDIGSLRSLGWDKPHLRNFSILGRDRSVSISFGRQIICWSLSKVMLYLTVRLKEAGIVIKDFNSQLCACL